ncbi:isoaspartyl peptidase/L-asparaginase family protein [Cellulophaga tyrosinoxydans]|uniref:N4-(Beta-N-acetylglucosaminyl)-L-asparaginase n=1 Tax=Cellulophaga tyrosinoxydans TaxID=504486 RepID=A0A1W1YFJ7_9FLAO|nr:N(4)-(beta-N-acetylglucosaminyl)-L-asparaginase [Cellulophaga tyrosinoxydans]SMC34601.1 N4-(beta-N-acetylglucosaminyl)-L-asparaginase [Cellulophaga tyrosinoxydans]
MQRRKFLKSSTIATAGLISSPILASCKEENKSIISENNREQPIVIATWNVENATSKAWEVLKSGGSSLDAVEQGVMIEEADVKNQSVGKGGRPDRDGNVTLDACIMDSEGNCGAVLCIENIVHPISVARKVMEDTPHVMLAGKGAEQFAYEKGFKKENLLTEKSKQEWLEWKKTAQYKPIVNIENHDTIGMLAIDNNGNISGACTTSGMAYKIAGRVGDSPIIGAGLFVDNEVGGATATGVGEEVVRTVGSFLIVELMRQGKSPQEACEEGVRRIIKKNKNKLNFQIGFIAINKKGETGGYCIQPGFSYRTYSEAGHVNNIPESYIKE